MRVGVVYSQPELGGAVGNAKQTGRQSEPAP
ncbi:hypothetical protein DFR72_117138 [Lentzea flaviverrucosa]|uniref:Uncharacterized protein n=1 Tax=Lentzea flaviverrucosa TaxID=200379 RepID=A0A1H9XSH2_9PSEU|nr:hypothetical protein DFR72_117138 [Lentzea flaviverrucosa]SES49125.1 hypothetical protein SAMN05216195_11780 [Lentzea flaviverrucosa]